MVPIIFGHDLLIEQVQVITSTGAYAFVEATIYCDNRSWTVVLMCNGTTAATGDCVLTDRDCNKLSALHTVQQILLSCGPMAYGMLGLVINIYFESVDSTLPGSPVNFTDFDDRERLVGMAALESALSPPESIPPGAGAETRMGVGAGASCERVGQE
ncbi:hypothetical protein [Verminephrobacter aporrectodeae]|uniref:hypothetical protein n=1 Tax=Verminephrobacter aporrectodeae TaxID=1110389 RepID=UPI0002375101|nr:hypothetical protein [Verminephrobacter aporrectodeae]